MARVAEVEQMLNERFIKQKGELEKMLRIQIEMEMKDEMERIRKEGVNSIWWIIGYKIVQLISSNS